MLNAIPVIGWLLSFVFSVSLAVPFWLFWTMGGIGARYFYWLPPVYHEIGFWSCVGLFIVIGILKSVLLNGVFGVSSVSTTTK